MSFDIKNKTAIVTGGASGIGLSTAKELLRNGLRGVILADTNESCGQTSVSEIKEEFGDGKARFVKTDVTDIEQFEAAFRAALEEYGNIDILINNAGILNEYNWQKEIAINLNGVVYGMLLGLDKYIPKYKSGPEGVIVNISSIAGVEGYAGIPVYTGTKFAVHGMTLAWGSIVHYETTKVKVVGICPGVTDTPILSEISGKCLAKRYEDVTKSQLSGEISQKPEECANEIIGVIKNAPTGTVWVAEAAKPAYQFVLPTRKYVD